MREHPLYAGSARREVFYPGGERCQLVLQKAEVRRGRTKWKKKRRVGKKMTSRGKSVRGSFYSAGGGKHRLLLRKGKAPSICAESLRERSREPPRKTFSLGRKLVYSGERLFSLTLSTHHGETRERPLAALKKELARRGKGETDLVAARKGKRELVLVPEKESRA